MKALADRITDLEGESSSLRSKVDTRYTANVLLGLGGATEGGSGETVRIRSSRSICKDLDQLAEQKHEALVTQQKQVEEDQDCLLQRCTADVLTSAHKRNGAHDSVSTATAERRAKGKYTPQERETIRRERNRIHAKKTRDRKKIFLEWSEKRIDTLESEVASLRGYLVSTKAISTRELSMFEDKDKIARFELANLKETNDSGMEWLLGIKSIASAVDDLDRDDGGDDGYDMDVDHTTGGGNSTRSGSGMGSSDSSVTGSPNHGLYGEESASGSTNSSNSNSRKRSRKEASSTFHFGNKEEDEWAENGFMRKHGFVGPPGLHSEAKDQSPDSISEVSDDKTEREQSSSSNSSSGDDEEKSEYRRWDDGVGCISSGSSDNGNGVTSGSGTSSTDGSTDKKLPLEKPSLQSLSVNKAIL